jgi:hypothetical protein
MAERKTRNKRPRDGHRLADRTRRSGRLKTCLWAALGLILGAVVALLLTSRTGMPGAIVRFDYLRLTKLLGSSSWLLGDVGEPVWEQFRGKLTRVLSESEDVRRHDALATLMTALVAERNASTDAEPIEARTDRLLQIDRDNLVARLAVGALRDRSEQSGSSPVATGLERFARLRGIVEQAPDYQRSTLHRQEYFNAWEIALKPFVNRPDVNVSLSRMMPEQFDTGIGYRNTYEGLLAISTTLASLSDTLRSAGHVAEAETCNLWVSQMALGLIENETDVIAQRLCTRMLIESLGPTSEAAHDLRTMIHELDRRREAAPRDLTSQSFHSAFGDPALDHAAYRRALASLVIVLALVLSAMGAGIVLLLAIAGAALNRLIRREPRNEAEKRLLPAYATGLMLFIPAVGVAALVWRAVAASDLYCSTLWGLAELCAALSAGALGMVAIAGFRANRAPRRFDWRSTIVLVMALLPYLTLASPPSAIARGCRSLDMLVSAAVVLPVGFVALVLISLPVSPARLRTIAETAALGLCVNAAAALAVMPFHRSADLRHQQAVVDARGDEFSARLGKDWQTKYLGATREALRVGAP